MNFTPIFNTIIYSSCWLEPLHVRVMWVTLLALKNSRNIVPVEDVRHLARAANLPEDQAHDAIRVLSSPDTKSATKQPFDGCRIAQVEGGWLILNGAKYQKVMATMANCARQARWRATKAKQLPRITPPTYEERHKIQTNHPDATGYGEETPARSTNEALPPAGSPEHGIQPTSQARSPEGGGANGKALVLRAAKEGLKADDEAQIVPVEEDML